MPKQIHHSEGIHTFSGFCMLQSVLGVAVTTVFLSVAINFYLYLDVYIYILNFYMYFNVIYICLYPYI